MHHQWAALCSSGGSSTKQEEGEGQMSQMFQFTKIQNMKTRIQHSSNTGELFMFMNPNVSDCVMEEDQVMSNVTGAFQN